MTAVVREWWSRVVTQAKSCNPAEKKNAKLTYLVAKSVFILYMP